MTAASLFGAPSGAAQQQPQSGVMKTPPSATNPSGFDEGAAMAHYRKMFPQADDAMLAQFSQMMINKKTKPATSGSVTWGGEVNPIFGQKPYNT